MLVTAVEQDQEPARGSWRPPGSVEEPRAVAALEPVLGRDESRPGLLGRRAVAAGRGETLRCPAAPAESCCDHGGSMASGPVRSPAWTVKYREIGDRGSGIGDRGSGTRDSGFGSWKPEAGSWSWKREHAVQKKGPLYYSGP